MAKGKRRATSGGWRQVAPLVPLALFASAFTVSATDDPAVATAALEQGLSGKNPVVVPKHPIADPANVPVPGLVGNGVDPGEQPTQVVSGLSRNGIPDAALKAYSRAQQVLAQVDPACQLPWTLVAAIGRVESNHGRFGGNSLNSDGVAVPGHLRPTAGRHPARPGSATPTRARSTATPPSTAPSGRCSSSPVPGARWVSTATATASGTRRTSTTRRCRPASTCAPATMNLSKASDLNQAVLRYNHSQSYVDLVVSIAKAYAGGSWIAVGNGTESDGQGSRPGRRRDRRPGHRRPRGQQPAAGRRPAAPTRAKSSRPRRRLSKAHGKPGSDPTKRPPTSKPSTQPTEPGTNQPPTSKAADHQAADDCAEARRRDAADGRGTHRRHRRQHGDRADQGGDLLPVGDVEGDHHPPDPGLSCRSA